ncbi:MAG: hypothetical protein KGS61_00440 [Verrucomicrobia bacterium]|nr:hypothetical protein [Verrucomicrobiota bacterium]
MRYWFPILLAGSVVAVGPSGCQSTAPPGHKASASVPSLTAAQISAAGLGEDEIAAATTLCKAKCLKCHKFYGPDEYNDAEWNHWMVKMSKKARLKPDQQELLTRFLNAFRVENSANEKSVDRHP